MAISLRRMKFFKLSISILVTFILSPWIENIDATEGEPSKQGVLDTKEQKQQEVRVDHIVHASQDKRSYIGLQFANKMKVLIIQDPTASTSAMSLSLGVGSFNDSRELPGLTNLVGLMQLLGSRAYPKPIQSPVIHSRMVTTTDTQNFTVEIGKPDTELLYFTLEKFASIMIDPLLDEASATALEDSIAKLSLDSGASPLMDRDLWVAHHIERLLSNKEHPNFNFSSGNKEIVKGYPGPIYNKKLIEDNPELKKLLTEKLRDFFTQWYSANLMTLVVLSNDPILKMEEEIRNSFQHIKDKGVQVPTYTEYASNPILLRQMIYAVPEQDLDYLRIFFPTDDVLKQYKTAPARYVSFLIDYQGPGSLISALRRRKLGVNLETGYDASGGFGIFHITCSLTKKGIKEIDTIIELIFQYINMVKDVGVREDIFNEIAKIDAANFAYKDHNEPPSAYVEELAKALQKYPLEDVLSFKYVHLKWDRELIEKFLSALSPENMDITILSKAFAEKADEKETLFGMRYKIEEIDANTIIEWSKKHYPDEFKIPRENKFIPTKLSMYLVPEDKRLSDPYLLHDSHISQFWFKQEDSFKSPKLHVYLHVFSPMSRSDPTYRCMLEILLKILNATLNEELYSARVAGLDWSITGTHYGIVADVYGYDDKMPLLLESIMEKFIDVESKLNLNEELFLETKKELQDDIFSRGIKTRPATDHGWNYLTFLLSESGWTDEDLLTIIEPITYKAMRNFFLPDFLENIHIQGLIHGNCNEEKAKEIIAILEKPFESIFGLLPQQVLPERTVELNEKTHHAFLATNTNSGTHAYYSYYQLNNETIRDDATTHLLTHAIDNSWRTTLTEAKMHRCGDLKLSGSQGLFLMASSDKKTSHEMDEHAENFLKGIPDILDNISEKQFKEIKDLLIAKKSEKPRNLKTASEIYWFEIMNRTHHFKRAEAEIEQVKDIKKEELLEFYKKNLDPSGDSRRSKLSIHIIPKDDSPATLAAPTGASKIENITVFKSNLNLLPLPSSIISANVPGNKSKLNEPLVITPEASDVDEAEEAEEDEAISSWAEEKEKEFQAEASTSGAKEEVTEA